MNKLLSVVSCISILLSSSAQAAPNYTFTTFNSLMNDNSKNHLIRDINDSGQILGNYILYKPTTS